MEVIAHTNIHACLSEQLNNLPGELQPPVVPGSQGRKPVRVYAQAVSVAITGFPQALCSSHRYF